MRREPEDDFMLQYLVSRIFFQRTADPVNELTVVVKYVVTLFNSGSDFSKMLAAYKSTIAILV